MKVLKINNQRDKFLAKSYYSKDNLSIEKMKSLSKMKVKCLSHQRNSYHLFHIQIRQAIISHLYKVKDHQHVLRRHIILSIFREIIKQNSLKDNLLLEIS